MDVAFLKDGSSGHQAEKMRVQFLKRKNLASLMKMFSDSLRIETHFHGSASFATAKSRGARFAFAAERFFRTLS
mgnify:CR=1